MSAYKSWHDIGMPESLSKDQSRLYRGWCYYSIRHSRKRTLRRELRYACSVAFFAKLSSVVTGSTTWKSIPVDRVLLTAASYCTEPQQERRWSYGFARS